MLHDDREGVVAISDAPDAAFSGHVLPEHVLADRASDARADELADVTAGDDTDPTEQSGEQGEEREWFGKHPAYPRNTPEHLQTPDLQTRLYVGLWLPGAGALLTYAIMRGNYWAAFVGIELLLVGWFTLAKL